MGLPKYVVNFDELTQQLKDALLTMIDQEIKQKYPEVNTNGIEISLEKLKSLLPQEQYKDLKIKIDIFVYKNIVGSQKIEGLLLDIPPIIMTTQHDFIFEKDVFLTGLHFNQTGWKKEDRYSLVINKKKIINDAATKEVGEHKHFNSFLKVDAHTPISFLLSNNSGNSRQTMIDLEYIEGEEITPQPPQPPSDITVDDIPNDWDIAVMLNWEKGSPADIDIHGYIKNNHVYFGCKESNGLYLNFDCKSHENENTPEILSVKGNKGEVLEIYVQNFKGTTLNEPITITVYHKGYKINILKEFKYELKADNSTQYGVCSINLSNLEIKELNKIKTTLNGGI